MINIDVEYTLSEHLSHQNVRTAEAKTSSSQLVIGCVVIVTDTFYCK